MLIPVSNNSSSAGSRSQGVSRAQLDCAVRSGGDSLRAHRDSTLEYYLFNSALVSAGLVGERLRNGGREFFQPIRLLYERYYTVIQSLLDRSVLGKPG